VAKPTILSVDADPPVRQAVERDLRARYSRDYRVIATGSGDDALDVLRELKLRDDEVALLVADQRMPGMTGIELLEHAVELFPRARRVLLTAYADTEVAIQAINQVRLDHYITKPWDPPEERLYPVLDDLLDDWNAGYRAPFEGVRVVGGRWSRETHTLTRFLAQNQVPYRFLDAASNEGAELLALSGHGVADTPLVLFADGARSVRPSEPEVAERIGLHVHAARPFYDLVIVGAGPAGLAAAVYGASEGLETLLVERQAPGGQAGQSSRIENYLGFPAGLSGADLARRAVTQATRFGAELLVPQEATALLSEDDYHLVRLADGREVSCHAVVVATGVSYRALPVPGAEEVTGAGIYYGASRGEATAHAGQDVHVVGGGNSAGQAALFLGAFAGSVTILVRGEELEGTMSKYLIDEIDATPNVGVRPHTSITGIETTDRRLSALIVSSTGEDRTTERLASGALFVFIGQAPRTDWLAGACERDEQGFILTGRDCGDAPDWPLERARFPLEASVPGVFVAGDVRHGSMKRVASATGEGAMAVRFVHEHLADR
jgi:thioredoxin reductase (NADPH)